VPPPVPAKKIPWLWIGIIAGVVLLIGGVTTALLLRMPIPNLVGDWVNDDPSVADATEITIARTGTAVSLQLYRKCSPTNCDGGTYYGALENNTAVVHLPPRPGQEGVFRLQLNSSGHLTCRLELKNDGAPQTVVWSFHKAG
jgi:hypothetical protein